MFFITFSYAGNDSAAAVKAFNEMERKYFTHAKVCPDDNLYINLLGMYLKSRVNLQYFEWVNGNDSFPVENDLAEAAYFTNASLKELSELLIIKMIYEDRRYKGEMTLNRYNQLAESIGKHFKIHLFSAYMNEVILTNNKIKTGDPFPVVSVSDINNHPADITQIAEPFILIDF